jgi:two-component system, sensor histidine kinase RpfC
MDFNPRQSCSVEGGHHLIAWIRNRLRDRPDTEHQITLNRLTFSASIVSFLSILTWTGNADAATLLQATYGPFILYFLVTLMLFGHILWEPLAHVQRRVLGLACDFGMISILAIAGGVKAGFFYPLYLWTVFGNGFRFGIPYLYTAMTFANLSFVVVLFVTGVWREHTGLSISLLACLILLPLYAAKLIRDLSKAKRQAEEASSAKSMFLASVSHELRTPLNAIIGLGGLLQDQIRHAERREMVSTIVNSGRSLLRLINNILDFSRIEAGRMPLQIVEVDLYEAVGRLKAMLAVQAKSKGLTFMVHIAGRTPAHVSADYNHIEQILINLVANAIKFTENGFVVVTVDAIEQQDKRNRLRFEVCDTGIGVPKEAQERIFESFAQADASILDRYGGTGLGLAISRQLVYMLNGKMGLESAVGKGSTFWFEVDVTQVSGDETSRFMESTSIVISQDRDIKAEFERAGICVGAVCRLEEALSICDADPIFAGKRPVVFFDHRRAMVDPTDTLVGSLRSLQQVSSGLVLVTDEMGVQQLSIPMRSMFVSSVAWPAGEEAIRRAMRAANQGLIGRPTDVEQVFVPAARSLSVLVAEDNRTNQMVIERTLERVGHRVSVVDNGEAAIEALENDDFDVVLMDVNMPVMNGIEATKLYRFASIGQKRVPIVALTADASSDAWTRCQEAGMDGYATKPIEPARLLEIIDSVVTCTNVHASQMPEMGSLSATDLARNSQNEEPVDKMALASLERLGGPMFISSLVSQFSSDAAELLASLRVAVEEEDVKGFRDLVHSLRGSAANLGAAKVFSTCLALRDITLSELAREGDARLDRLMDDVDDTIELLRAHVLGRCNESRASLKVGFTARATE